MGGFCNKCQMSYAGNRCPITHKRSGSKTGGIIFGIIISMGIGFLIYDQQTESLEIDPNVIPNILTDISSNIPETKTIQQEITKIITPKPYNLYTYSVNPIPNIPDKTIPVKALIKSISSWEQNNPGIIFIEDEDSPHMTINWKMYGTEIHEGLASCIYYNNNNDSPRDCILDISLGNIDCNGNYVQWDVDGLSNTIMHEMGHSFGLDHNRNENHLMYGIESLQLNYDTLGYDIPTQNDRFYVGQKEINDEYDILQSKINQLEPEIKKLQSQYDSKYSSYSQYEGKTLPPNEYQRANMLYDELSLIQNELNDSISKSNQLIEQGDIIVEKINCFSNVES